MSNRRKIKNKYNQYRGIIIAFIFFVCFIAVAYHGYINSNGPAENTGISFPHNAKPEISYSVTDKTGTMTAQQLSVLESYAENYANTLATLSAADISSLYADSSSPAYYLNQTALKVLTTVRSMRDFDLTLEQARVEYAVEDVLAKGNTITVTLLENNTQKFRHLSQPSESANLNHVFTLVQIGDDWLIESHEHEEDFYLLTAEAWQDATGADNSQKAENALALVIADATDNLSDLSQFQQGKYLDLTVADTSYDRQAAVDYAQQWWNIRNYGGGYLAYDAFGGNCQNFASQCIHAGGIAMDYTGILDLQWKFYDERLNTKQSAYGRSYSWTGVDMFYNYALNNYSDGLVSLTDIDFSYAQPGDIIHVGAYHRWRHALVVTDVLKNADGTLQDIVVASNTADRWNYPLSAYIYTAPRLIHILGQN